MSATNRRFEAERPRRFFEVEIDGSQLTIRQGRQDSTGKEEIFAYQSKAGAREAAEEMIRKRLAKGFQEVGDQKDEKPARKRVNWRQPRCFVKPLDDDGNESAFVEIWLQDNDLKLREGKVGEDPKTETQAFKERRLARNAAEKLVAEKVADSYREVRSGMFKDHRLQWMLSHRGDLEPFFQRVGAARGARNIQDDAFGILKRRESGDGWEGAADVALFNGRRVPIVVNAGDEGPSDKQRQVYQAFRSRQVELRPDLRDALFNYYQSICEERRAALDSRVVERKAPELASAEQIWPLVEGESIAIPTQEESQDVEIHWSCTWDDDADIAVCFRDWANPTVESR